MQLGLIIYDKWWIRWWVRTVKPPLSCHPRGTSKWPRVSHRSCHKLWIVIFNWAETSLYFKTITEREQHYRSSVGRHLLIFFIIFLKIKPNLVYQVLDGRLIVKSSGQQSTLLPTDQEKVKPIGSFPSLAFSFPLIKLLQQKWRKCFQQ